MDLPDRDQFVSRSPAQEERAQGRRSGREGFRRRRVRRARPGGRRTSRSESGTRLDATAAGIANRGRSGETDSARTDGLRVKALSRIEATHGRRDFAYDGRDSQEHTLPGHAEIAWSFGGYEIAMSVEQGAMSNEQ